jgi:hypothetical protein
MARKRGGLAGFYDRNKGVLQTAAPIAAGFFGGPLAGAAVGAAMRGLDREGKSGIGFDVKQGVAGGLSGYGGGSMGAGIKNMLTGQMAKRAALKGTQRALDATKGVADMVTPDISSPSSGVLERLTGAPSVGMTPPASSAPMYGNIPAPTANPLTRAANTVAGKIPSALRSKEGLAFAGSALQAGAGIMGSQAQIAQQEREYEDEQRMLRARAEMFAMLAPQMAGNLGMTDFTYGRR